METAEIENAQAFKELCSLFDKSLEFSTQVASSLEEKRSSPSEKGAVDQELDLSLFSGGVLRDYQKEGTAWMVKLRRQVRRLPSEFVEFRLYQWPIDRATFSLKRMSHQCCAGERKGEL